MTTENLIKTSVKWYDRGVWLSTRDRKGLKFIFYHDSGFRLKLLSIAFASDWKQAKQLSWSIRHYRGLQYTKLVLFVLVLNDTPLVLEQKYWISLTKGPNTGAPDSLDRYSNWIDSSIFEDEYEKAELLPTQIPEGRWLIDEVFGIIAQQNLKTKWPSRKIDPIGSEVRIILSDVLKSN